jgi:hypothetical protein
MFFGLQTSFIHANNRIFFDIFDKKFFEVKVYKARQSAQQKENKEKTGGLDKTTKEVLHHFGNVVGSFFTLLQDTNNVEHVGSCLNGMLSGMVNIGVAALKHTPIDDSNDPYTEEEIQQIVEQLIEDLQESVAHIVTRSAH